MASANEEGAADTGRGELLLSVPLLVPLHYTLLTQFRQEAPLTLRLALAGAGAWLSHVLHGWHSRE